MSTSDSGVSQPITHDLDRAFPTALWWNCIDRDWQFLYAGALETPVASIRKASKWWELIYDLPGAERHKRGWLPYDEAREFLERSSREWFAKAGRA